MKKIICTILTTLLLCYIYYPGSWLLSAFRFVDEEENIHKTNNSLSLLQYTRAAFCNAYGQCDQIFAKVGDGHLRQ